MPGELARLRAEMDRCRRDPAYFVRAWLGIDTLWEKQVEILAAIRDHRKVCVASCHDSGKTFVAGAAAIWFFVCHWPSVVVTTAPGGRQNESLLWSNIRAMNAGARVALPGQVGTTSWKLDDDPRSYMIGFTTSPDRAQEHATRFTGFHSEHLLLIFDEAAAVEKPIWDAAHGLMTSGHARWLAIGNPSDPSGEFARAYHSDDWHAIHIDAYETPNIRAGRQLYSHFPSLEWLEEMQRKCGPDYESNPEYQFKVRGIFPTSAVDTLIGVGEFLEACRRRPEDDPEGVATMGVDVARYGGDRTAIVVLRGGRILHAEAYGKQDVVFTAGRVMALAPRFGMGKVEAERIAIDDTGVGGGVVDVLRANGWGVSGVNFGEAPEDDEGSCVNRRTELWVAIQKWIREEACLACLAPGVREELRADLTTVKYSFRPDGRRILEPKEEIRKRIGRSPDYGDALALALAWGTTRPRLCYGPSSKQAPVGHRLEERDHPEDTDHPGHALWLRQHMFDHVKPAGNPFRDWKPRMNPLR